MKVEMRTAGPSLLLLALMFTAVYGGSLAGQEPVPRLEPSETCPMHLGDDLRDDVSCGWLVVPQDRRAGSGTPMRLAYAVARAESDDRLPDPIVVHFGGPSATLYRMDGVLRSPLWSEIRLHRDIIFLDQRGTGFSEPRPCRSLHEFFHDVALLLPAERETNVRAARLAAECRESARAEGVELSAFGGAEVAEDYEDLRSGLGYEQWNWYGVSYGGMIGQILLRQYPERLRAVFLGSPAVLGATDHGAKAFGEALDQLFSSCRADSQCSREYPRLAEDFDLLMARLEATPVTLRVPPSLGFPGDRFVVNRNVALFAIQKSLSGAFPAVLPALVTAAARGSNDPLHGLKEFVARPWNDDLDMTVSLVVRCMDMEVSERATMAERAQYPRAAYGGWMTPRVYALCDSLGVEPAARQDGPIGGADTPVLVLGGGRDSWSAPSDIRAVADRLDNATLVYAPDEGHGIASLDECSRRIVFAFFVDPQEAADVGCMTDGDSGGFLTDLADVGGMGGFQTWVTGYLSGSSSSWLLAWAVLPLLVLLSALVVWPFMFLWRRYRARAVRWSGGERAALATAFATSLIAVLFWVGLYVATQTTAQVNRHALAVGVIGDFGWVFALPWALMGLTSLLVIALVVAWRHGYWSVRMRVHFSMVACASVAFMTFIARWPLF